MAKYIVIEDFESQWFRPTSTTPQIAVFKKDSIVQALPSPVDGKLVTRVDGTLPTFKEGEILVSVVENKVKMLPDEEANKLKDDQKKKKMIQYAMYAGGAIFLLWWLYGKNRRKTKTLSGTGGISGKKKPEVYNFVVPTWALSYLINSDPSGLSDEEIKKVDKFADEVYKLTKSDISMGSGWDNEGYFKWRNDIDGSLGANVVDVEVVKRK